MVPEQIPISMWLTARLVRPFILYILEETRPHAIHVFD